MSKSKTNFLDKFSRQAAKAQKGIRKNAEIRIMREEKSDYVVKGIRVKNAGFTLIELLFVLGFFSVVGLVGFVVVHFLSKGW